MTCEDTVRAVTLLRGDERVRIEKLPDIVGLRRQHERAVWRWLVDSPIQTIERPRDSAPSFGKADTPIQPGERQFWTWTCWTTVKEPVGVDLRIVRGDVDTRVELHWYDGVPERRYRELVARHGFGHTSIGVDSAEVRYVRHWSPTALAAIVPVYQLVCGRPFRDSTRARDAFCTLLDTFASRTLPLADGPVEFRRAGVTLDGPTLWRRAEERVNGALIDPMWRWWEIAEHLAT